MFSKYKGYRASLGFPYYSYYGARFRRSQVTQFIVQVHSCNSESSAASCTEGRMVADRIADPGYRDKEGT